MAPTAGMRQAARKPARLPVSNYRSFLPCLSCLSSCHGGWQVTLPLSLFLHLCTLVILESESGSGVGTGPETKDWFQGPRKRDPRTEYAQEGSVQEDMGKREQGVAVAPSTSQRDRVGTCRTETSVLGSCFPASWF